MEKRDYSNVSFPWDDDPNWDAPRVGATYDRKDPDNWCLACSECGLHFPTDLIMRVVADHWKGHFPEWTEDKQEPRLELHLRWIGLGVPPTPPETLM
jgi:hypothetical protein